MIGQRVSHYHILDKLGEGGMGVVYKAQDTKLDRVVALKFLPPHLSASEQDKARFVQEAKAAAALNHPNICTIYGIEEHDGQMFIAMEFVEGQTLREKGQNVPLKQAIEVGIQLADGFAAAHEKGIVHRDLKPENVMLQKDGRVKIMDFGLAKLKGASRLTKAGTVVGTAGYMSPEQVQGLETDHRTDIFSLGVLLYEMFAGQSPFKGVHETAINYEIVNVDPEPITSKRPDVPRELDAIVLECLEKDPGERYQSVAEIAKELRRYKRESSRTRVSRVSPARQVQQTSLTTQTDIHDSRATPTSSVSSFIGSRLWVVTTVVLFLGLVGVLIAVFRTESKPGQAAIRFSVSAPNNVTITGPPIISPDGQRITFSATDSLGKTLLWVRSLDQLDPFPLVGTDDASFPFWSADSRFIGFFSRGKMKKVEASSGAVETLCDAPNGRGGAWNQFGEIIFSPTTGSGLHKVSAAGGEAIQFTSLDTSRQESSHRWPQFLPDGKHVLFFVASRMEDNRGIHLASLASGQRSILLKNATLGRYAPSNIETGGHLLFVKDGALMAQRLDNKYEKIGDAFPVAQRIASSITFFSSDFSVSSTGVLVYRSGGALTNYLAWFDRSGRQLGFIQSNVSLQYPNLSPDEKRVVATGYDQFGTPNIWIVDLARGINTRFTFFPTSLPIWSPDGQRVIYTTQGAGTETLFEKVSTGAGNDEVLYDSPDLHKHATDWSRDGRFILYDSFRTQYDLYVLPMTGERIPVPYLQSGFEERFGQFSPDGKWVAYASNERGSFEIFVQPFPPTGAKWQVSGEGGIMPRWRRDGKELYFIASDGKLHVVPINLVPSFEAGSPKPLFQMRQFNPTTNVGIEYAVTRDGQRFLVSMPVTGVVSTPITIVMNWEASVQKK